PLKKGEATLFVVLMLAIYLLEGGPIDLLSHIIFSFHMLQMAILFLIIAPLMFYAIPEYIVKYVEELPVVNKIVSLFTKPDRKSTRLNSSHVSISYAVFCSKKKD